MAMILDKIRQVYPELTKSQRLLADYIAGSYQEAAFMTASRLAQRLGLNEATVIRFAQRLGYRGYPDLIQDVQRIVYGELQSSTEEADETLRGFGAMVAEEIELVRRMLSHIPQEGAQRAVSALRRADSILVIASGLADPLGRLLVADLQLLGFQAALVPSDSWALALALDGAGPSTLVVGLCIAHENDAAAQALALARRQGARTLALTSSPISPCAQAAELALSCPLPDQFPLPSVSGMAVLLDALLQMLAQELGAPASQRLKRAFQIHDRLLDDRGPNA